MPLRAAIATARESVVAIFKYRETRPETTKKGKVRPAQYSIGWGSGFCIVQDRYVMTAFHVLNGGQPRDPADRFLAFVVPGNGAQAFHYPITGFPLERPDMDLAILELGPCATPGIRLPALPISLVGPVDGSHVLTIGFPAPEVAGVSIDPQGVYRGGNFFLKSHANEGIISAQYNLGAVDVFEFNVGWHHGESGGPVLRIIDPVAAITIMQQYRNIQSPHGVLPGPHRGCALGAIRLHLAQLGVTLV